MSAITQKQATEKFAEENNLSIDEMNAKVQEVYDSYNEADFANDDARWSRAYRRVRGAFRKKARSMANSVDGMIVCRMTNKDFDRNQFDYAMRTLESKGLDEAVSLGLVNKEGQPIYKWGDNKGKVIEVEPGVPGRPQASGRAIAYTFEKNSDGEYKNIEPRFIVISKDRTDLNIPVCQVGRLAISISDKKQSNFKKVADNNFAYYNDASISNDVKAPYSYDEVHDILVEWNQAFSGHFEVISNVGDLGKFADEHAFSKDAKDKEYDFCVIPGNVSAIVPAKSKYHNATVTLEFIDSETLETSILNTYIPETMLQGLHMVEDDQGVFVLQAIKRKEDKPAEWHLGGFLHVADDVEIMEFFEAE